MNEQGRREERIAEALKAGALLDITSDLVTVVDQQGRLIYVNRASEAIFGLGPDQALGRLAFDFVHADDRASTQQAFEGWIEARATSVSWENRQVSVAGDVRHMLWTINLRYVDDALESVWSIARDVTPLREAERLLADEHEQLSSIFDGIEDLTYVADPESHELLHVNRAFERSWGADTVGQKCHRVIQGLDEPCSFCTNDQIFGEHEGQTHVWEYRNAQNGRWYRCADRAIPWRSSGHKVRFEIATDITEQVHVAEDLRERIKELACLHSIGKFVEKEGSTISEILAQTVEVLPGSWLHVDTAVARITWGDEVHQTGDLDSCVAVQRADLLIAGEAVGAVELGYREERPDRDEGPFLKEERALIEAIAERLGHAIERDEAERSLVRERATLQAVFDGINDVIYVADPETYELLHVNAAAKQIWGDDIVGQPCYQALQGRDAPCPFCTNDKIFGERAGQTYVWEFQNELSKDWFRCSDKAIRWVDGRLVRFELASNITAIKQTEAELKQHRDNLEQLVQARTAVMAAVNRVLRDALTCDTVEEVAGYALQVAEELTGSKFGFIGEVNAAGRFDTIAISNPGWEACAIEGSSATMLIRGMEQRGIWATVLKSGASQIVNDPAAHPERVGTPQGHPPLTSFLGVPLRRGEKTVGMIALGNKAGGYVDEDRQAIEALAGAFDQALTRKRMELQSQREARLRAGQAELAERMQGDQPLGQLCSSIISYLCTWLDVPVGLLYLAGEDGALRLKAGHAYRPREGLPTAYRPGEGLVGQAALDRRQVILTELPEPYFALESGLGQIRPSCLLIEPIVHEGRVKAVVELGALGELGSEASASLEAVSDSIALALDSAQSREAQAQLLEESQRLTEELQSQQEELRVANEELEEQTQALQQSELRLKAQQEELQVINEELEEKNELLGRQKAEVDQAQRELTERAEDLALASKYKSEFLANMSHELRTPLNSLLLLSRSLSENKAGNLSADQVESAEVIYQGGNDLLALINEILDLSKIEAGRMDLSLGQLRLQDLAAGLRASFNPLAAARGLELTVSVEPGAPEQITSDRRRLEQVLKNLVANSIKFTEAGSVRVNLGAAADDADLRHSGLDPRRTAAITVVDTGIGVSPSKQKLIFEAFQQAEQGTARRYGGTGLGLSISRELVKLLGGEIQLISAPGEGAAFTVFLPLEGPRVEQAPCVEQAPRPAPAAAVPARPKPLAPARVARVVDDDREQLDPDERAILLVEDDPRFAAVLVRQCREQGLKVLAAANGEEGLELARRFTLGGVLLDLKLPGIDGWRVLELLKEDPATRHIPVHILTADAEPSVRALRRGAVGYAQKPVSSEQIVAALDKLERTASNAVKRVLVVEDDEDTRRGITALIGESDVKVDEVAGGAEAIEALQRRRYDCMILDLGLWDFDGDELLRRIEQDAGIEAPPVIVYTARDLTWEQNMDLRSYSDSIIVKGVRSDERLLDEVSLFLHHVVADLPEQKRQVITSLHDVNALLRGKKALVVDDDMRTLFALTRILTERGMEVLKADNGEKALGLLEQDPGVDVVLMDIMMPVMDGYETMRRIRAQERFKELPIIALTAKAMSGDQELCVTAGASDYLPKPVDQDRLISLLRVWLYR